MASSLKYVDLYLTSEWGRFYVGPPVLFRGASASKSSLRFCTHLNYTFTVHTPIKIQTKYKAVKLTLRQMGMAGD
jgi:hypothetical protein